ATNLLLTLYPPRKTSSNIGISTLDNNLSSWIRTKHILNKKIDIFWQLAHRALPLGYRLKHISQEENGCCPCCQNSPQTLEHFALSCEVSQAFWNSSYNCLKL